MLINCLDTFNKGVGLTAPAKRYGFSTQGKVLMLDV